MRRIFAWVASALLAFEAGATDSLEAWLAARGYLPVATVPGETNRIRIFGSVGASAGFFAIDTGWPYSSLDPSVCDALPTLSALGRRLPDHPMRALSGRDVHVAGDFRLGGLVFANTPFTRQSMTAVFDPQARLLRGALGWDFLSRHHALVRCNPPGLFVRSDSPTAAASAALLERQRSGGLTAAPFLPGPSGGGAEPRFFVSVQEGGRRQRWLVDTGAYRSIVTDRRNRPRDADPVELAVGVREGAGALRLLPPSAVVVGAVSAGPASLASADLAAWRGSGAEELPDGLLGMDLLARLEAWIDFEGARIFLRSPGNGR